jgi:hypothetical protein
VGLVGPNVDPLGDELIKLLPDGLRELLAPAVAPPAFMLPEAPAPAAPVFPLKPVVVPPVVDAPVDAPAAPPAEPPLCASARLLVSASAVANPRVVSLITISLSA